MALLLRHGVAGEVLEDADETGMVPALAAERCGGVEERPNMPGTMGDVPNWSLALPAPLEEFGDLPLPGAIAAAFDARTSSVYCSSGPARSSIRSSIALASPWRRNAGSTAMFMRCQTWS